MPYTTESEIAALLPPEHLRAALDDDSSGTADTGLLTKVIAAADQAVDSYLGARFAVPRNPPEPIVRRASLIFALEALYLRRGLSGAANPHAAEAAKLRTKLDELGRGVGSLSPEAARKRPSVSVASEPSKLHSSRGAIL
jgi:phage gp36-like protein